MFISFPSPPSLAWPRPWPASGDKPTARCRNKRRSEANLAFSHVIIYLAHDESRSLFAGAVVRELYSWPLGELGPTDP
jgi:hypothetical protein